MKQSLTDIIIIPNYLRSSLAVGAFIYMYLFGIEKHGGFNYDDIPHRRKSPNEDSTQEAPHDAGDDNNWSPGLKTAILTCGVMLAALCVPAYLYSNSTSKQGTMLC